MTDAALALAGINKRFGDTPALVGASVAVAPGSVHALLGENGAGKTTLMRIAFGMIQPDAGDITVSGHTFSPQSPADAIRAGIGMVHQHFTHIPAMTVVENVALGGHGVYRENEIARRVMEIGDVAGLRLDPHARVSDLSLGAQQRLEIVKALVRGARLLILDEPTAVLAPHEARELLTWLRSFTADGRAAILITHKLREAFAVADTVTVLRRGRTVFAAPAHQTTPSGVAEALLGEAATSVVLPPAVVPGVVVARAEHADIEDHQGTTRIADASFQLHRGEVLGIAAVEGSGQQHLLRALARRLPVTRGTLLLPHSVAFIPEDRHRDALLLELSLTENIALRGAGGRRGTIDWRALRATTTALMRDYDVRGEQPEALARTLSGGNQQKLVLARELAGGPELVVAENPTRGLDIRATQFVHAHLLMTRDAGGGVVLYSSDLDEVVSLSTRVLVIHSGRVHEVPMQRDAIGRAMVGLE